MPAWAKRLPAAAIPFLLVLADRFAKRYALTALPPERSVVLFPGFDFGFFQNTGLLFSTFNQEVAAVATAIALGAFIAYAVWEMRSSRAPNALQLAAGSMIILGGASNAYDRFFLGGVVDYLLFLRSAWNIADIMILAGIALLIWRREPKGDKTV